MNPTDAPKLTGRTTLDVGFDGAITKNPHVTERKIEACRIVSIDRTEELRNFARGLKSCLSAVRDSEIVPYPKNVPINRE